MPQDPKALAPFTCPSCGYELQAHRPGERCPECGVPLALVDFSAQRPRARARVRAELAVGLVPIAFFLALSLRSLWAGRLPPPATTAIIHVLATAPILATWAAWRVARRHPADHQVLLYSLYGLSLGFALGLLVVLIPTSPHAAYRPPVGPGEDWPFVLEVAQVQLLVGSLCFALFGTVSWLLRKLEGPPA